MTANEHYAEAEKLLRKSDEGPYECPVDGYADFLVAQAQAHATLALAARPIVILVGGDTTPEMIDQLNAALNPDLSKPQEDSL